MTLPVAEPTPPGEAKPTGVVFLVDWLFLRHWRAIDEEAAAERARLGERYDARPLWILVLCALVMVFQEYYGDRPFFSTLELHIDPRWETLAEFAWWSGAKVFGYLVVPFVALLLAGFRPSEMGFGVRGMLKHVWIYVALFGAFLPILIAASYTRPFQATYPFYKLCARSWTDLLAWEALYASSFLALEFFFRGFLLFGLRRPLGSAAIFVMCVPYCMIHFHKPVAEVTGAIFAGIILGTLALRTRSIWCGFLIHVSVALSMDLLALAHTTGFPGSGRFVGP